VIHLGAVDQARCQRDPDYAWRINVEGTEQLVRSAVESGAARFIYFSTFQVYGKLEGEINESTPVAPARPYPVTKWEAEKRIRRHAQGTDMKTLILRLSNTFGPPMDPGVGENVWTLVFNSFCRQVLMEGKITVGSNQYRDFIPLTDVVRAAGHFLYVIPEEWGDGLFNLGGECCLSIVEAAQLIAQVYEKFYGGGRIPIQCPPTAQSSEFKRFHYQMDKLRSTGFRLQGDQTVEIQGIFKLLKELLKGKV
jgi:UDP-glucose 4-epimerase